MISFILDAAMWAASVSEAIFTVLRSSRLMVSNRGTVRSRTRALVR